MKLNMWMIYDNLPYEEKTYTPGSQSRKTVLSAPMLYDETCPLTERYIYVVESKNLPVDLALAQGIFFLVIGEPPERLKEESIEYIAIYGDITVFEAYQQVQRCFDRYFDWAEAIQEELNGEANIDKLCKISLPIAENPILVHNANFEVVSFTEGIIELNLCEFDASANSWKIPKSFICSLNDDPDFWDTMDMKAVSYYRGIPLGYPTLYANILLDDEYAGRLVLAGSLRSFRQSDYFVVKYLTSAVQIAFRRHNITLGDPRGIFEHFLADVLEGKIIDSTRVGYYLNWRHWQVNEQYICIKIGVVDRHLHAVSSVYSCSRLEEVIDDCCAFPFRDGIACIVRLGGRRKRDISAKLSYFLREGLFTCGISNEYQDLMASSIYYDQASIAFSMGTLHNPSQWSHTFKEYSLLYLYQNGAKGRRPSFFCDETVLRLKDYNKDGVDYYTTLKVYLRNNMNLLHSSQELFIHRTTLFYRLNRIKELVDVDLNDYATRFRLLFSFALLDMEEAYLAQK